MLADNLIELKQCELMIDWCAGVLDAGSLGTSESSMAKVAVSEALMRIADRCVQVMGGAGVSQDTIVEQVFREIRAFRIYDGPTEVHKFSLAKKNQTRLEGGASVSDAVQNFAGTTQVRSGFEIDRDALARWMSGHVADFSAPLEIEQFRGGQSNPTYRLVTPSRSYVLRRKPSGTLVKGAHAVEREAKVLSALGGTGFPVPRVYALCMDESIIGAWFYIMEMVEGRIFWERDPCPVFRGKNAWRFLTR